MSNTNTNGGPAFPEIRIRGGDNYNQPMKLYYGGMTLRDYFAGQALVGILQMVAAGKTDLGMNFDDEPTPHFDPYEAAADAYLLADAMLRNRKDC